MFGNTGRNVLLGNMLKKDGFGLKEFLLTTTVTTEYLLAEKANYFSTLTKSQ